MRSAALFAALLVSGLLAVPPLRAQEQMSPVGLWQTVSDVDGRPKGYVRISESQGEYRGVIEEIFNPEKRKALCVDCPGERQGRPVLGLTVITGVHWDGSRFAGGEILDPDNGRVYSCRLRPIDGGKRLEVRGYLGFSLLGRTQTWVRHEEPPAERATAR